MSRKFFIVKNAFLRKGEHVIPICTRYSNLGALPPKPPAKGVTT